MWSVAQGALDMVVEKGRQAGSRMRDYGARNYDDKIGGHYRTDGKISWYEFCEAGTIFSREYGMWKWAPEKPPDLSDADVREEVRKKDKNMVPNPEDYFYLICRDVPCKTREEPKDENGKEESNKKMLTKVDADGWETLDGSAPDLEIAEFDDDEQPSNIVIEEDTGRVYDIIFAYNRAYQTPQAWFRLKINNQNVDDFELYKKDIIGVYIERAIDKTVSHEPFKPLGKAKLAAIHPCHHAAQMKRLIDVLEAGRVKREKAKNEQIAAALLEQSDDDSTVRSGNVEASDAAAITGNLDAGDATAVTKDSKASGETAVIEEPKLDDEWHYLAAEEEPIEETPKHLQFDLLDYLTAFHKFMSNIVPGIVEDHNMSV